MFNIAHESGDTDLQLQPRFRFKETLFGGLYLQFQHIDGTWHKARREDWVLQKAVRTSEAFRDALKKADFGAPGQIRAMGTNGPEWRDPPSAYGTAGVQPVTATWVGFEDTVPVDPRRAEKREGWGIGKVKAFAGGVEVPIVESPPNSGKWVRVTEAELDEMHRPRPGFEVTDDYGTHLKPGEAGTYTTPEGQVTVTVGADGTRKKTFNRADQTAMPDHPAGSVEDDRLFQLLTKAQQDQLLNVRAFSNSLLTVPKYLNALIMFGDIKNPGLLLLDPNHNPTTPENMEEFRAWLKRGRDGFQP